MIKGIKFALLKLLVPGLINTAVSTIIIKNKKILLEKRNAFIEKGKWCLPGGHIDFGETAVNALKREIKEEIGLTAKKLEFLGYFDEIMPEIKKHSVVLVYRAKVSGKIKLQKNEVSEIGWFTKEQINRLDMAFRNENIIKRFWGK